MYLKEKEAAEFIGFSVRSLQAWRQQGRGPKFHKIGKSVRYTKKDLSKWINSHSEPKD